MKTDVETIVTKINYGQPLPNENLTVRVGEYEECYSKKDENKPNSPYVRGEYSSMGNKVGEWKWYFRNGQIRLKGRFKEGTVTGIWEEYTADGKLIGTGQYDERNGLVWKSDNISISPFYLQVFV